VAGDTLTLNIANALPAVTVFLVANRDGYSLPWAHSLLLEYCGYEKIEKLGPKVWEQTVMTAEVEDPIRVNITEEIFRIDTPSCPIS